MIVLLGVLHYQDFFDMEIILQRHILTKYVVMRNLDCLLHYFKIYYKESLLQKTPADVLQIFIISYSFKQGIVQENDWKRERERERERGTSLVAKNNG